MCLHDSLTVFIKELSYQCHGPFECFPINSKQEGKIHFSGNKPIPHPYSFEDVNPSLLLWIHGRESHDVHGDMTFVRDSTANLYLQPYNPTKATNMAFPLSLHLQCRTPACGWCCGGANVWSSAWLPWPSWTMPCQRVAPVLSWLRPWPYSSWSPCPSSMALWSSSSLPVT